MGYVGRIVVALWLGLSLSVGAGLAAPPAAEAATYRAVCGQSSWTGKDPRTCRSSYRIYQITANRPRLVFSTNNARPVSWNDVRRGYRAANDWCNKNTLTCGIVTAVGVQIAGGWIAQATS